VNHGVAVTLFETVELLDVVQIRPADHHGVLHLIHGNAHAPRNLSTDGDITGERALLVDVLSRLRLLRSGEAQTHVLVVALNGSRFFCPTSACRQ